ncbi:MAG: non-ribosomal peptide synthetase [Anaerolineales bacterium]|nr:non-ribosomal peptide synthetase [Anaerolineales bacterium]
MRFSSSRHEIAPAEFCDCADPVPVGVVCEGHEVLLLDDKGVSVAPGEIGQIVVRSEQLSPGYWRNPALTAAKFRPDPVGSGTRLFYTGDLGRFRPDGALEHCGRLDFMVKIRGFRVEPEAIASALKEHPAVVECVVVANAATEHDPRLVAYYAVKNLPGPTTQELRTLLAQTLPPYMIPARFVRMAHLPRNMNGKIDRTALPAPDRVRPELETPYVAPRTDLETNIAELWAEALELDLVGVDDNFFALGGDSLSALRIVLQVETFTGRRAPPGFFDRPTVANLAQLCHFRTPQRRRCRPAARSPNRRQQNAKIAAQTRRRCR